MKLVLTITALLSLTAPGMATAVEIEHVTLPESIKTVKSGKTLVLNGAGIRTKFIFDIYVCGLYLENKSRDPEQIINSKGEKRILMHFLYDEVEKEKLVNGWSDGFEANHTEKQMDVLRERLTAFNNMFSTVKKGNTIRLDFLPNGEVRVLINDTEKGIVRGHDFQQGLLRVWLGDEPVTGELKSALLGNKPD